MGSEVQKFEQYCRDRGLDYEVLTHAGGDYAEVRFSGQFHRTPVIWHARIMTLEYYRAQRSAHPHPAEGRRQFIAVGDQHGHARDINIALRIRAVDTPTILKTIIMVRQWKNLDYGMHEFGPV